MASKPRAGEGLLFFFPLFILQFPPEALERFLFFLLSF